MAEIIDFQKGSGMSDLEQIVAKSRHAAAGSINEISHSEAVAAALALNRPDWLKSMGYTLAEAMERVGAKWLALIPEASRQLQDEAAEAAIQTRLDRAEAVFERSEATGGHRFSATLVTYGEAPGYRDASFTFDMIANGSQRTHRAEIRLRPEDAAPIVDHLKSVHRLAWNSPHGPIDIKLGELRPGWIDA